MSGLPVHGRGSGPPALLLHGAGMSSRQWRSLTARLSPAHRVLAPELSRRGDTASRDDAPSFARDLDACAELLERVDAPTHVVGHSYGGRLALELARRSPTRLASLSAYDPVAFGVLHDPVDDRALAALRRLEADPVFTDPRRAGGDAWMERFVDFWSGAGAWRALPAAARGAMLRAGPATAAAVLGLMQDRTPARAYASIATPTLLLAGERSPLAARRVTEALAAAMPRARRIVVAGAGHMGPLTAAAVVDALIAEHIADAAR